MVEATGTTRRGRGARAAARQKRDVKMLPALKRNLPLTEPMNQEQIERMDAASMHILENVGVHFRDPIAIADIRDLTYQLKDRGIGVLITDHNVRETLDIIDRAYIIHDGHVLTEGTPHDIVANEDVRRVYLGEQFML